MKVGCITTARSIFRPRKLGWKPPEALTKRLKRLFPRIYLMWSSDDKQWALVEHGLDGHWHPVKLIEGKPNLQNTVFYLCWLKKAFEDVDKWLDEVDEPLKKEAEEGNRKLDDRAHEGHERMWHLLGTDHTVSFYDGSKRKKRR